MMLASTPIPFDGVFLETVIFSISSTADLCHLKFKQKRNQVSHHKFYLNGLK